MLVRGFVVRMRSVAFCVDFLAFLSAVGVGHSFLVYRNYFEFCFSVMFMIWGIASCDYYCVSSSAVMDGV